MNQRTLATIVEGHGEVQAVPVLLRRVFAVMDETAYVEIPRPHRVPRDSLLAVGGLERAMTTVLRLIPGANALLILLGR